MPTSRLVAPVVACVFAALALPAAVAGPATAAPRTAARASGPTEHVLLALTPESRSGLRALARGFTTHHGTDAAALRQVLPSAARRRSVAATARSLGLTVDRVSRLSVLVSGRASLVEDLFGSARSIAPTSTVQHPLPYLPAALRGEVTLAVGGDDHRPAFHHFALTDGTADGTDFRTAYGDADTNPLTTPSTAEKAATIATVQLSGWHSNDLSHYAAYLRTDTADASWPTPKYVSIDDPLLPSHVAQGGPNLGNDEEVDLDQEAIYGVAPYAHQRAYLSGNDLFGMYDSLAAIGDDASDPTIDRHLVAASISWGFCETDLDTDPSANSLYAAFEDVLSYDLATGVTVFAASGDNGGSCDGTNVGVSYPASSPQVVGVGGTQHAGPVTSTPPSGWSDGHGASGGGVSEVFPAPAYQAGVTSETMRAVPDISALASDPAFDIYTSSPLEANAGVGTVGGTSLASPVAAATYTVQVAKHNYSWGVGNILPGLYAQPAGFTDVTTGSSNGVATPGVGYDQVTGLGTPLWSSLISPSFGGDPHLSVVKAFNKSTTVGVNVRVPSWAGYDRYRIDVDADHVCTVNGASPTKPTTVHVDDFGIKGLADGYHDLTLVAFNSADNVCHYADAFVFIDTEKPTPTAKLAIGKGPHSVVASWTGNDSQGLGSGIASYTVKLGYPGKILLSKTTSHSGSVKLAPKPGKIYTLSVTATDFAGNVRATSAKLFDDKSFSFAGTWSRSSGPTAFDGSEATSVQTGAHATVTTTGKAYTLYVTTCSACGRILVTVAGKHKTIDTYSKATHDRVPVTVFSTGKAATRKIVIKVLGTKNSHSGGHRVIVDGLASRG